MSSEDELWDLWASAVIEYEFDGRTRALRGPDAGALPIDRPFFVLTAYNPGGVPRDDASNEAAQRQLEGDLIRRGALLAPATGRSRDGSWSEPGVAAIGLDRSQACELGNRYGQLAIFELTAGEVHVVRCEDGETVRTRRRDE